MQSFQQNNVAFHSLPSNSCQSLGTEVFLSVQLYKNPGYTLAACTESEVHGTATFVKHHAK